MKRISITCAKCGGSEFEVERSIIPNAIKLACENCGTYTPIAFFDRKGRIHTINGEATLEQYDKSFCGDVEPGAAEAASRCDSHKQLIYNRIMESIQ